MNKRPAWAGAQACACMKNALETSCLAFNVRLGGPSVISSGWKPAATGRTTLPKDTSREYMPSIRVSTWLLCAWAPAHAYEQAARFRGRTGLRLPEKHTWNQLSSLYVRLGGPSVLSSGWKPAAIGRKSIPLRYKLGKHAIHTGVDVAA